MPNVSISYNLGKYSNCIFVNEAEEIGFRDDFIYKYINNKNKEILKIEQLDHEKCLELFEEYKEKQKQIY